MLLRSRQIRFAVALLLHWQTADVGYRPLPYAHDSNHYIRLSLVHSLACCTTIVPPSTAYAQNTMLAKPST